MSPIVNLWKPWLTSAGVFAAVFLAGFWLVLPLAGNVAERIGTASWVGNWVGGLLYLVIWVFASSAIYLAIVGLMSSLLWDTLSYEIESRIGPTPKTTAGCGLQIGDTLARLPFSVFIACLVLFLGWTCFGVVGIVAAGLLGLFDFTACSFLRRGHAFWGQWILVWRAQGWGSFVILCGIASLLPVVNVLLLPVFVAGGTLLARRTLYTDRV